MKYDKLIKDLRICASPLYFQNCDSCEKCSHSNERSDCYNGLKRSAADAIEELLGVIQRQKEMINATAYLPLYQKPKMADCIEREAAFNAILKLVPKVDGDGYCWVIRGDAAQAIDSIPSADVAEVRHGKWSDEQVAYSNEYGDLHFGYKCSACGAILNKTNYCGACGAKMRETDE